MLFARRYLVDDATGFIGGGGFGRVYRALDTNQNQVVALKLLRAGSGVSYAFREAQELTRLGGEFILRVHNADVYQDVPYIATELAAHGSAADALIGTRGVPTDRAVMWTRHLLGGLIVCHAARPMLLHRDIKPANLFIRSDGHAQLGDFGVVETPDQHGYVPWAGSPRYLPPEAVTEGRMSIRSDIYGVGITMWEILTGSSPFAAIPLPELGAAIASGVGVRLYDVAPHVPTQLSRIVERAMNVDPDQRYATAEEMDGAIGRLPLFKRVWAEEPTNDPRRAAMAKRRCRHAVRRHGAHDRTGGRGRDPSTGW